MKENILHISLVISIIGLLILTYASTILKPPLSEIGNIKTNFLGKNVHIQGDIIKIHKFKGGSIILKVRDSTGEIDVYLRYSIAKSKEDVLDKNKKIDVIGEVELYEGRLEVVPNNLDCVKVLSD